MKIMKQITLSIWFFLASASFGYFYTNNFNAPLNISDWTTNFRYGMEGLVIDTNLVAPSRIYVNSGLLIITNDPYASCTGLTTKYNGFWVGNSAKLEKTFSATPTQPFGFEIKRVWSDIDADCNQANPNSPSERSQAQLDIWLVKDDGSVNQHWDAYGDYFLFFENGMRGNNMDTMPPNHISQVGYYDGNKHLIDFGHSTNAYDQEINLTNHSIHSINWQYNWIGDSTNEQDATHLNATAHYPNTNEYTFKIIHDGEYISLYINPDPDDNDAYPNEFCKVAQKKVLWNDNLKIIVGHEVKNFKEHHRDVKYDFLRIVSAADKSKVQLDPEIITPDMEQIEFIFNMSNDISPNNAGINYVEMEIPKGLVLPDDLTENMSVIGYKKGKQINFIPRMLRNGKNYPNANQVAIRLIKQNKLALIFGSSLMHSKNKSDENLKIKLNLIPQYLKIQNEAQFELFVENRQFDTMPQTWGKDSTCGLQKCTGNLKIYKKQFSVTVK